MSTLARRRGSFGSASTTASVEEHSSYEKSGANPGDYLRESVADLVNKNKEIQQLFSSVADRLEAEIGEDHELVDEWDRFRKRYRTLHRDSQLHASQIAHFLNNYQTIIVPISRSGMSLEDKTQMITKFIEAISAYEDTARQTSDGFRELRTEIEVFPTRVSSAENKPDNAGTLSKVWACFQYFSSSITTLEKLFRSYFSIFADLLGRMSECTICIFHYKLLDVQFDPGRASSFMDSYPYDSSQISPTRSARAQIKRDTKDLTEELYGFEDIWMLVRSVCQRLLQDVSKAKELSPRAERHSPIWSYFQFFGNQSPPSTPKAADDQMETVVGEDLTNLIECLTTYSTSRASF